MHLNQKNNKVTPKETYKIICECLEETHALDRGKTSDILEREEGPLAFLRQNLFHKPLITNLVVTGFVGILSLLFLVVSLKLNNSIYMRLVYIFIVVFMYFSLMIFLLKVSPKYEMEYDERWSRTVSSYLMKTNIDFKFCTTPEKLKEARRRIKRGINYYNREGTPLKITMNFVGGGIVIGCLPDPNFQKALITYSILEIFSKNQLGAVSILILPIIAVFYSSFYGLPIAWMEQVISQIELELEE
jgi:hypothetical protein